MRDLLYIVLVLLAAVGASKVLAAVDDWVRYWLDWRYLLRLELERDKRLTARLESLVEQLEAQVKRGQR